MGEGSGPALPSPPHLQAKIPHRRGVSCEPGRLAGRERRAERPPTRPGPGRLPEGNEQKQPGHWPHRLSHPLRSGSRIRAPP